MKIESNWEFSAVIAGIIVAVVVILVISAFPKPQASIGLTADNGALPADMCYVDGLPVIFSLSTESEGGYTLTYLNKSGAVIGLTSTGGKMVWNSEFGCPSQ